MPQVIVKKRKTKETTEGIEKSRRLAKQVLSQLSCTPFFRDFLSLDHFCRPRISLLHCHKRRETPAGQRVSPAGGGGNSNCGRYSGGGGSDNLVASAKSMAGALEVLVRF